jgi:hypothetical protein
MTKQNLKIFVAYHNENYPIFKSDIFEPIFCGKSLCDRDVDMLCDNTGDNISDKNRMYSENTAHYWVLKNYLDTSEEDYIGFCHYRRIIDLEKISPEENVGMYVLKYENLKYVFDDMKGKNYNDKIKEYDCIIPPVDYYYQGGKTATYEVKLPRITCIEEMDMCRKPDVLDAMIRSIEEVTPEYVPAMTKVFTNTCAHLYNIYILKKEHLREYLEWEFKIFFEMEKRTNNWNNGEYKREAGYFAEKFINIWLEYKKEKDPNFKIGYSQVYTYDIIKESIEKFKFFHSIGRYDLEIKVMEKLTTLIPEQASLYKILAQAYGSVSDFENEKRCLERFQELSE